MDWDWVEEVETTLLQELLIDIDIFFTKKKGHNPFVLNKNNNIGKEIKELTRRCRTLSEPHVGKFQDIDDGYDFSSFNRYKPKDKEEEYEVVTLKGLRNRLDNLSWWHTVARINSWKNRDGKRYKKLVTSLKKFVVNNKRS